MATPSQTINPPAVGMDSYAHQQKFAEYFADTDKENAFTSAGIISSLKAYNDMAQAAAESKLTPEVKMIWEAEAKWFGRAARALQTDKHLQDKCGSGWEGVVALTPMLKRWYNNKVTEESLGKHAFLDTDRALLEKKMSAFS